MFENTSGSEIAVTVDVDLGEGEVPQPAFLKIGRSTGSAKGTLSPVRFIGSGTLRQYMKAYSFHVYANGKVIFDDHVKADFITIATDTAYTNRMIEICGNARFEVQTVKMHASDTLRIHENGVLDVTKGTVAVDSESSQAIDFAGGKVFFRDGCTLSTPAILPRETGTLDFQAGNGDANALRFTASIDQELSGMFYATNAWGMKLEGVSSELWGRGSMEVGLLYVPASRKVVLDLTRLNFGNGYYISPSASVTFPSDIIVGQFGADARNSDSFGCFFAKTLTLDTTDAHDGTSPRTIRQFISPSAGTLRIIGGGTAYVGPSNQDCARDSQAVRAIEVEAGATLGLMPSSTPTPFRFGFGCLGRNAKLLVKASAMTYDFTQLKAEPSSKIEVDVAGLTATDTQKAGNLVYPILHATLGDGIPLANVMLKNNTGNWVAKSVGASIYLRNDAEKFQNPAPFFWTGAVDGNWSDPGNWLSNAVPTSTDTVYFGVSDRSNEVTIPVSGVSIRAFNGAGLHGGVWYRSSEPYVFRGGKLTICQDESGQSGFRSAFFDCGRMSKVFENDVEFEGEEVYLCPYHVVAFNGAFAANRLFLHAGDIRFGGKATIGALSSPVPKYVGDARGFSIHVMSGGMLTVIDQSNGSLSYPVPLIIDGGASMTVNGAYRQFASSSFLNFVDGHLAFADEYISQCDQTFAGTGRVDVAGTRALANNVAIEMKGGIRLFAKSFQTVSQGADYAGASIRLRVPDYAEATVGALRDWTYGPADGAVPTTSAASRAIELGKRSTLMIDTTDPDTQVGRKVAFVDPVIGEGRLVVVGKGTLILKTAEFAIAEFDVSGGTIDVDPSVLATSGWTKVLTAKKIMGIDGHVSGNLRASICHNEDGTVTLLVAPRHGLTLCVR